MSQIKPGPSCPWPLRCLVTRNPCGTDTVRIGIGGGCKCRHCLIWTSAYPNGLRRS